MSNITVSYSADIDAGAHAVYAVFADYEVAHPAILPKDTFKSLTVIEGGYGEGTVFDMVMRVMGKDYPSRMDVSEPEPGRVMVETEREQDLRTTFTVDPLGPERSRLTIETVTPRKPGLAGMIEAALTPRILRGIYRKEVENLKAYLAEAEAQPSV